jgi:hypothetical protein
MFIMAIGVVATINIGQAIHKRIHTQNIADMAAYSLAAQEARLFNFWAFTNRAQASLYNTMMFANSIITELTYNEAFLGMTRDSILTFAAPMDFCCHTCCDPPYCVASRAMCAPAHAAIQVANVLVRLADLYSDLVDTADSVLGNQAIPATWAGARWGLYGAQQMVALGFQSYLWASMKDIVELNDREEEVDWDVTQLLTALLNQYELTGWPFRDAGAIDDVASGNPGMPIPVGGPQLRGWSPLANPDPDQGTTNTDERKARQYMADVALATRHSEPSVTRRTSLHPVGTTGLIPGTDSARLRRGSIQRAAIPALRRTGATWGDAMTSDAGLNTPLPGNPTTPLVFVTADIANGAHQRWAWRDDGNNQQAYTSTQSPGYFRDPWFMPIWPGTMATSLEVLHANSAETDTNHPFFGIAPYMKFRPSSDPNEDFNQPSTWSFINIKPQNLRRVYTLDFRWTDGSGSANLNFNVGRQGILNSNIFRGLNAISRGQVYYHRGCAPDDTDCFRNRNWKEHPNFFNPFWGARLAPVGLKLQQLQASALRGANPTVRQILGPLGRLVTDNIITH